MPNASSGTLPAVIAEPPLSQPTAPEHFAGVDNPFQSKNVLYSFSYALEGLEYAFKTQRNFRIHLSIAAVAVVMATIFHLSLVEWAMIWGLIGLVLFAELTNTAIELVVDMMTQGRYDLRAKAIKDVAAGAVFVTALSAVACGVCLFVPRIALVLGLVW